MASDGFAERIISSLRTEPIARVVVPYGRDTEQVEEALSQAAFDQGDLCVRIDLGELRDGKAFIPELSRKLECRNIASNVEDLLKCVHVFYQPRLIVLAGSNGKSIVEPVLAFARSIAFVTRDLSGPIRFVWVHAHADLDLEPAFGFEVWPPEARDIPQVSFSGGLEAVLYRTLRLYIDRRTYWEAAGQTDRMRVLFEQLEPRVLTPTSPTVDENLDQVFDNSSCPGLNDTLAWISRAPIKVQDIWVQAIRQAIIPRADPALLSRWVAEGLVWQPPGLPRWRVTPMTYRVLLADSNHPLSAKIGPEGLKLRLRRARSNHHIAQMAMLWSSQVEEELLVALRNCPTVESLIDRCKFREVLQRNFNRALRSRERFFSSEMTLLDFATFGQLVGLAQEAGSEFRFPLSRDLLFDVVDVRNLAAHGLPVRWNGLKQILEAVYTLVA